MKKNRTIGIIGHFGGTKEFYDGQTIKTKILYNELMDTTNWKIFKVDTFYKNKNPIKLVVQTIVLFFKTKDIIILLSGNGMKLYFPILYLCNKILGIRVYHDVIGGNLDSYVIKKPKFKKYLNSFKVNWVETETLKSSLNKLDINNCEVIPNFKRLTITSINEYKTKNVYKFCAFSRVMKEKGVEDAINAIESINQLNKNIICTLDIYGKIDEEYRYRFEKILSMVTDNIKYKGVIPYTESTETLKEYFALLFPTFWKGEGFPGTIIDAFSAGVPVIATKWNSNSEIIEDKINGLLYPNNDYKELKDAILWLIKNNEKLDFFKKNCILSAKKYQPEKYIKLIVNFINETIEGQ